MKGLQLTLCESDFNLLTNYCVENTLSAYNRNKLLIELKEAKVVKKENLPLNIVATGSKVLLWNIHKGHTYTIWIVPPAEADGRKNKVSSLDPIAIALLGYPSGSVVEWEMGDEINQLKLLSVNQMDMDAA